MTKEEMEENGQKVTTYYVKEPKESKRDDRREGESRVEQNRRKREEARVVISERPDSRESLTKESKRKEKSEATIKENVEKVKDKQFEEEYLTPKKVEASRKASPTKQAPEKRYVGNAGRYISQNMGAPVWMGMHSRPPVFMNMGPSRLPPWVMGGSSPMASPVASSKRSKRRQTSSTPTSWLPPWFRY